MLQGRFRRWNDANVASLREIEESLTAECRATLNDFQTSRKGGFFTRLAGLRRTGVFRQTLLGNIGLVIAAAINRL